MKTFSKFKKDQILQCIAMLEYGDTIECDGTYLSVYNSSGCLIDTIYLNRNDK